MGSGEKPKIWPYIRKPFLIYDFAAPDPFWILLYICMRKFSSSFLSVYGDRGICKKGGTNREKYNERIVKRQGSILIKKGKNF